MRKFSTCAGEVDNGHSVFSNTQLTNVAGDLGRQKNNEIRRTTTSTSNRTDILRG